MDQHPGLRALSDMPAGGCRRGISGARVGIATGGSCPIASRDSGGRHGERRPDSIAGTDATDGGNGSSPLLAQLKSNPNNSDLLYKLGNIYYDAQQYADAVNYYDRCLKINPKATDVRTDMATAYHFMGQTDRALQEYGEVLKIDGAHANALFNTGMVKWQDKQDMSGAIVAWKRLLETNPQYPQRDKVQQLIAQAEQHLSMQKTANGGKTTAN